MKTSVRTAVLPAIGSITIVATILAISVLLVLHNHIALHSSLGTLIYQGFQLNAE